MTVVILKRILYHITKTAKEIEIKYDIPCEREA
jgi:hypothetical protein